MNYWKVLAALTMCLLVSAGPASAIRSSPGGALLYLHSRPYDTATGRFITPDTATPAGNRGANRYAYTASPATRVDPSGHDAVTPGVPPAGYIPSWTYDIDGGRRNYSTNLAAMIDYGRMNSHKNASGELLLDFDGRYAEPFTDLLTRGTVIDYKMGQRQQGNELVESSMDTANTWATSIQADRNEKFHRVDASGWAGLGAILGDGFARLKESEGVEGDIESFRTTYYDTWVQAKGDDASGKAGPGAEALRITVSTDGKPIQENIEANSAILKQLSPAQFFLRVSEARTPFDRPSGIGEAATLVISGALFLATRGAAGGVLGTTAGVTAVSAGTLAIPPLFEWDMYAYNPWVVDQLYRNEPSTLYQGCFC